MSKEARDLKYRIDGYFLRHFQQWPPGIDPGALLPIQREFALYLMAVTPSIEVISTSLQYQEDLQAATDRDYGAGFSFDPEVAEALAGGIGLTRDEFIEKRRKEYVARERAAAISAVNKKYGIEQDDDDIPVETAVARHYEEMTRRFQEADLEKQRALLGRPPKIEPPEGGEDGRTIPD